MTNYISITRAGDLYIRIGIIMLCAAFLFVFGWIGRKVFRRDYSEWLRLGWVFGVLLSVFAMFMSALTM